MLQFHDIMNRIKKIIYEETKERVYDKDLATELGLKASHYAVLKKRHRIPYEAITRFAYKKDISLSWIFFDKEDAIIPTIKKRVEKD